MSASDATGSPCTGPPPAAAATSRSSTSTRRSSTWPPRFDIVFWPAVMDGKYADVEAMPDGSIDVTLFNGGIRTDENEHLARLLRRKSKILVAFGSCASEGCIPGPREPLDGRRDPRRRLRGPEHGQPGRTSGRRRAWAAPEGELHLPELRPLLQTLDQVVDGRLLRPRLPARVEQIAEVVGVLVRRARRRGAAAAAGLGPRRRPLHRLRRVPPRARRQADRPRSRGSRRSTRSTRSSACSSRACPATARRPATAAARCARPSGRRASAATAPADGVVDYGRAADVGLRLGRRRATSPSEIDAHPRRPPRPGRPVLPLQPGRLAARAARPPARPWQRPDRDRAAWQATGAPMTRLTIDPITRLEGHGKIEIFLDDAGRGRQHLLPDPRAARLRAVLRRPAGRGDADADQPHLRRLPGGPPHGRRQGRRRGLRRRSAARRPSCCASCSTAPSTSPTTRPTSTPSAAPTSSSGRTPRSPSATSWASSTRSAWRSAARSSRPAAAATASSR